MVLVPFLITFREGLEAALIIAIIVAYLTKIGKGDLKKYAWYGTGSAIILSAVLGALILIFFGNLSGVSAQLFEGTAAILATVVLTSMIFWMARNAKRIKGSLQEKIDVSISMKHLVGITAVSFIAVFREGIETVLFLAALFGTGVADTMAGFGAGIVMTVIISFFLFRGSIKLPLDKFFKYTSVLLIVFAAGLFGYGIHEYMEAAEGLGYNVGFVGKEAFNINPASAAHPLHEKGWLGSILKSLVGYDGNPEVLRVMGYMSYWLFVGGFYISVYNRPFFDRLFRMNGRRPAVAPE